MADPLSRRRLLSRSIELAVASSLAACERHSTSSAPAATASVTASPATSVDAPASSSPSPPAASAKAGLALFRAFPSLEARLPRTELGTFPTPVERATHLGARLDARHLIVKRDDASSALYGGGKVRKLELFFGDALEKKRRAVITFGGAGSNQAVATAIFGARLGLDVTVCLAPQPRGTTVRTNLLALAASGATIRDYASVSSAEEAVARLHDDATYVIPMGGTSPLGNLAFVSAGLELAEQIAHGGLPRPRRIYAALGSGGSALGLSLGLAVAGVDSQVVGVRASNPGTVTEATLSRMLEETCRFARGLGVELPAKLDRSRLRIEGGFVGRGYGHPTARGLSLIDLAHETEGWELEPVYTAKALAAAADDPDHDEPILFWSSASRPPRVTDANVNRIPRALRPLLDAG